MPVNEYFGGHGNKVMADMQKREGAKAGKAEFYATANKRGQTPGGAAPKTKKLESLPFKKGKK